MGIFSSQRETCPNCGASVACDGYSFLKHQCNPKDKVINVTEQVIKIVGYAVLTRKEREQLMLRLSDKLLPENLFFDLGQPGHLRAFLRIPIADIKNKKGVYRK